MGTFTLKYFLTKLHIESRRTTQLIKNIPEDQIQKNGISKLLKLFSIISDRTNKIVDEDQYDNMDKEQLSFLKEQIYNKMVRDVLKDFENILRYFCEFVLKMFRNFQVETDEIDACENLRNIMKRNNYTIENIFKYIISDLFKNHIVFIISGFGTQYNISCLNETLKTKKELFESKIFPYIFPQTYLVDDPYFLSLTLSTYELFFQNKLPFVFEIIMEYPTSTETLNDFQECLKVLNLGELFCERLQNDIKMKLLCDDVDTTTLIEAYIRIIKSLQLIDKTSFFVEFVIPDIQKFISSREDSVRSIVKMLTEYKCNSNNYPIYKELQEFKVFQSKLNNETTVTCTLDEMYLWTPLPKESFGVSIQNFKQKSMCDFIMGIYESASHFGKKYMKDLCNDLLSNINFDIELNFIELQMIKSRCTKDLLRNCDVMLEDVLESKKINESIMNLLYNSEHKPDFTIQAYIISYKYWPDLTDKQFQLPETYQKCFDEYAKYYSQCRPNRHLTWCHMAGSVEMELEFNGLTTVMKVLPLEAMVMHWFSVKSIWALNLLAKNFNLNLAIVRRAVEFWIKKGILIKFICPCKNEVYMIIGTEEITKMNFIEREMGYIDRDEEYISEDDNFWRHARRILNYENIRKKLTDFEKLYRMLGLVMTYHGGTCDISEGQFERLLNDKIRLNQLEKVGEHFSLIG